MSHVLDREYETYEKHRARLVALLYRDKDRYEDLAAMAAIPELAEGWRKLDARRVETRATESWTSRLDGPQ